MREPVCSERDIRVPERSEDGCPCRSKDNTGLSRIRQTTKHKGTGTIRSDIRATQQKRVSIIRSDIRVPERSKGGFPCRSKDNTGPLFSVLAVPS